MARSWPKCFFAAWAMAFCSVSTRTERSMPLSFATWSRTMFRLTIGACGAGAAISSLSFLFQLSALLEHWIDVRLADLRVWDAEDPSIDVQRDHSVLVTL